MFKLCNVNNFVLKFICEQSTLLENDMRFKIQVYTKWKNNDSRVIYIVHFVYE